MGKKMTIKEAAEHLGLAQHFIRQSIHKGEIPFIMAGVRYVLDIEEVEEILKKSSFENMHQKRGSISIKYGSLRTVK